MQRASSARIKKNYYTDTVDLEIARKMDAFKVMRRKLKPLTYGFVNLKKGCEEVKSSLTLLKADIENGNNARDKYDEYLKFESDKVYQLQVLCAEYHNDRTAILGTYYELFDFLNKFSLDLAEKAKSRKQ